MKRDALTVSRSKADFRMMREMLQYTQPQIAVRFRIAVSTVKNWENPKAFYPPQPEVWQWLESKWAEANRKAEGMVELACQAAKAAKADGRELQPLMLTYWRQVDWAAVHGGGRKSMDAWHVENLAARMVADRLRVLGLPVTVMYAEIEP